MQLGFENSEFTYSIEPSLCLLLQIIAMAVQQLIEFEGNKSKSVDDVGEEEVVGEGFWNGEE